MKDMRVEFEALVENANLDLMKLTDGSYINHYTNVAVQVFEFQQAKIDSLQAALAAVPAPQPVQDVGTWLWCALMDYCKQTAKHPRDENKLFELVNLARAKFKQPAQEPAAWMAPSEPKSCNVITVEHKDHLSKVESWDGYEKEYAARFTVPLYFGHQQPAQEPVAWMNESTGGFHLSEASITEYEKRSHKITALYVKPTN